MVYSILTREHIKANPVSDNDENLEVIEMTTTSAVPSVNVPIKAYHKKRKKPADMYIKNGYTKINEILNTIEKVLKK